MCINVDYSLVLVSTIDGRFSALTSEGTLQWQVETDPGPLLVSNIHHIEVRYKNLTKATQN